MIGKVIYKILLISLIYSQEYDPAYREVYDIGKDIAEGINLSILTGLSLVDDELQYSDRYLNETFTFEENTWPIINVFIDIESQIIGDIEIKYFLLLENDQNGVVVGTVKTMRVDGDYDDPFLTMLNNTMYIETDDGTEQVQIIDDQLYFVE
tara:strand:- start:10 stop:465 length:456 start_codon:yes stop_codon:yes gene_type:complete